MINTPISSYRSAPVTPRIMPPKPPRAEIKSVRPFAETAAAENHAAYRAYGKMLENYTATETDAQRDEWVKQIPFENGPLSRSAIFKAWGVSDSNRMHVLVGSGRIIVTCTAPYMYGLPGMPITTLQSQEDRVMAVMSPRAKAAKVIAAESGIANGAIYAILQRLVDDGRIVIVGPDKRRSYAKPTSGHGITLPVAPWEQDSHAQRL